jgi:hypothetical protein
MNESSSFDDKHAELASLKLRVQQLEAELAPERQPNWPPKSFYNAYYLSTGTVLGGIAAAVSLLANVIGAPLAGKSPLELIRVYLTFPLGEKALSMTADTGGLQLAILADGPFLWRVSPAAQTSDRRIRAGDRTLADQLLRHPVLAAAAVVRRRLDYRSGTTSAVGRCRHTPDLRLGDRAAASVGAVHALSRSDAAPDEFLIPIPLNAI